MTKVDRPSQRKTRERLTASRSPVPPRQHTRPGETQHSPPSKCISKTENNNRVHYSKNLNGFTIFLPFLVLSSGEFDLDD